MRSAHRRALSGGLIDVPPSVVAGLDGGGRKRIYPRLANTFTNMMGHPVAFSVALIMCIDWTRHIWGADRVAIYDMIATAFTYLLVFLVLRDARRTDLATQAKLDEIIHAISGARDELIDIDEQQEEVIEKARRR